MRLKPILNGATLSGTIYFGFTSVLYYAFGLNPLAEVKLLNLWIPLLFLFLSLHRYREQELEGFASFFELFRGGWIFGFIHSSMAAMLLLLQSFYDPNFFVTVTTDLVQAMETSEQAVVSTFGQADYEEVVRTYKEVSAGALAFGDFLSKWFATALLAILVSFVLRKSPPAIDEHE